MAQALQDLLLHSLLSLTHDIFQVMALGTVFWLLLVVVGLAREPAPAKPEVTPATVGQTKQAPYGEIVSARM